MHVADEGECVQEDWQMRRQAVETFITLAAAVQVSMHALNATDHCHQPCATPMPSCPHTAMVDTSLLSSVIARSGMYTCLMISSHANCVGFYREGEVLVWACEHV